jgi:hypothetical protein
MNGLILSKRPHKEVLKAKGAQEESQTSRFTNPNYRCKNPKMSKPIYTPRKE